MPLYGFQWNVETGYRELMRSAGVAAELLERSKRIAEAAGPGFEADVEQESGRRQVPRASVRTATFEARRAEAKHHALERAIDAGR